MSSLRCALYLFPHLRAERLVAACPVPPFMDCPHSSACVGATEVHPGHLLGHLKGREEAFRQAVGFAGPIRARAGRSPSACGEE